MCGSTSSAPTLDDCRVTDPDRDGAPGIACKYRGTPDAETRTASADQQIRARTHGGAEEEGRATRGVVLLRPDPLECSAADLTRSVAPVPALHPAVLLSQEDSVGSPEYALPCAKRSGIRVAHAASQAH